jgi:hypothetical protein
MDKIDWSQFEELIDLDDLEGSTSSSTDEAKSEDSTGVPKSGMQPPRDSKVLIDVPKISDFAFGHFETSPGKEGELYRTR